jgi:hypothetical protein
VGVGACLKKAGKIEITKNENLTKLEIAKIEKIKPK